jgi:uncharacterized membrane protein (DUF485 family)
MESPSPADPAAPAVRAAHDAHVSPNAGLGMGMFLLYLLLYLGFMGIAMFNYELFGIVSFGGVNVAILYGLGLIVAALILALIYMLLCKPE